MLATHLWESRGLVPTKNSEALGSRVSHLARCTSMLGWLAHRCEWRDNAQLLQRAESVHEAPMLRQLAVIDTEDMDPHHGNRLARGSHASERALVGAANAHASHHLVPVSQQVLHGRLRIWEGRQVQRQHLASLLGHASRHRV